MKGVAVDEIAKFQKLQKHWWNPSGPLRSLHSLNPARVQYINSIVKQFGKYSSRPTVSSYLSTGLTPKHHVLDVGCGGGILSESLARVGATVTGIDMCVESVHVAQKRLEVHLDNSRAVFQRPEGTVKEEHWPHRLNYRHVSVFDVVEVENKQFDIVVASEVIEHVSDARAFLEALCRATKPGGLLILSTMDKTIQTAITHIAIAEYLVGVVSPGTHDWSKFIPPGDITRFVQRFNVQNVDLQYLVTYPDLPQSFVSGQFQIGCTLSRSCNTGHYMWAGVKRMDSPAAPVECAQSSALETAPSGASPSAQASLDGATTQRD